MIVLSGADLVLPDRILGPGTLVIDGDRIVDIRPGSAPGTGHPGGAFAFHNHYIVPAFIDVHVHGVEGTDVLDDGDAVAAIAARLPRYGVGAFCPTTVASRPDGLRRVLDQVRRARVAGASGSARVLPAHVESNFISPEYAGAQPLGCLRSPRVALQDWGGGSGRAGGSGGKGPASKRLRPERGAKPPSESERGWGPASSDSDSDSDDDFDGADILREIERARPDVGIVTIAPELDGGLNLIRWLSTRGHRVSLGHSGASYDVALEAIAAGARQATHLFNRMPPIGHRAPGLAGAVLQAEEIAAEIICDGFHVHAAMVRTAVAAKRPSRMLAISDGTAASGLAVGASARLGGLAITARKEGAYRNDGTLAGSVLTMDRAFAMLIERMGFSPVDAATMCATTPARELGLVGHGVLAPDAVADLAVLDARFSVVQTYIGGQLVYARSA